MSKDYSTRMKEKLIQLKQNWMAIIEYKRKFNAQIIYFPSLGELDKVCIFVNGLDYHITFMVKAYNPKTISKAYRVAIHFET
jgi:hypothetical protein